MSRISSLIWGPISIPSFIFASHLGTFSSNILIYNRFIHTFHKVFHVPSFIAQRGADKFSPEEEEE